MIKIIKQKFESTAFEHLLQASGINTKHTFITPSQLNKLAGIVCKPKQKQQLITHLKHKILKTSPDTKITLSNLTYKIKLLLLIHNIVYQFPWDSQFQQLLLQYNEIPITQIFQNNQRIKTNKLEQFELIKYIHNELFVIYGQYIKKMCSNIETMMFIRQFQKKQPDTKPKNIKNILLSTKSTIQQQRNKNSNITMHKFKSLQLINHGFIVINLGGFILSMKDTMNKMGRYHPQFQQVKSIFLMLIKDLNIFNMYIKRSLALILRRNIDKQDQDSLQQKQKNKSRSKHKSKSKSQKKRYHNNQIYNQKQHNKLKDIQQLSLNNISITKNQTKHQKSVQVKKKAEKQQIDHGFLYMNQCQKLSDKLYYFYFNRYYYKSLGKQFVMPSFLKIDIKYQDIMKNRLYRYHHQLLNQLQFYKYDNYEQPLNQSSKTTKIFNNTEIDQNHHNLTANINIGRVNMTMNDQVKNQFQIRTSLIQTYYHQ